MYAFTETQKFRKWWIWAVLLLPYLVLLVVFLFIRPLKEQEMETEFWVLLFLVPLIGIFVILLLRLDTYIDREKITYRFFPFHFKPRVYYWTDIESAYVREYKPMREYGGWGIRTSFRNGKAFNVSGNHGLQLVLKNGKKILLGTQQPVEIQRLLLQLKIPAQPKP